MNQPNFVRHRQVATKARKSHQFVPGIGYLAHEGEPELGPHHTGTKNCDPPANTSDGSLHLLRPPGGHPPMAMAWVAAEKAWASLQPERGNRLAWSTDHLKRAGWEYVGTRIPEPSPKRIEYRDDDGTCDLLT